MQTVTMAHNSTIYSWTCLWICLWGTVLSGSFNVSSLPEGVDIKGDRYEVSNDTQLLLHSRARTQCFQLLLSLPPTNDTVCAATWDRISCWEDTEPGEMVYQPCPYYIHNFKVNANVSRYCQPDGTWYVNPKTGHPWSDYSKCETEDTVSELFRKHVPKITILYNIGYGISLLALLVAVFIMLYFRKLRCPRNTLHLNLFLSFILRALMSFLRENLFINKLGLPQDIEFRPDGSTMFLDEKAEVLSHWECKTVTFMFYYSLSANYIWIFMEGLYLHNLIIVSVFSEQSTVVWYIVCGWLTPFTFLIPWAIVRAHLHNIFCWNISVMKEYEWIYKGPLLFLILVNFGIFINILRVLFTKLTASNTREGRRYRYIKLAKSTLVLIPLFGVHYILFSLVLDEIVSDVVEVVKLYFEMICNSFQGFLVALLYCFLNGEVQAEIRKKWKLFQLYHFPHKARRGGSGSKSVLSTNGVSIIDSTVTYHPHSPQHKNGTAKCPHKGAVHQDNTVPHKVGECGKLLLEGNDDCFVSESGITEIMCINDTKYDRGEN